jgi:hypothetical protein
MERGGSKYRFLTKFFLEEVRSSLQKIEYLEWIYMIVLVIIFLLFIHIL